MAIIRRSALLFLTGMPLEVAVMSLETTIILPRLLRTFSMALGRVMYGIIKFFFTGLIRRISLFPHSKADYTWTIYGILNLLNLKGPSQVMRAFFYRFLNNFLIRSVTFNILHLWFPASYQDPFSKYGYTIIPAWITNHIQSKLLAEITYLFQKICGCIAEFWEWISYFIPDFTMIWQLIHAEIKANLCY